MFSFTLRPLVGISFVLGRHTIFDTPSLYSLWFSRHFPRLSQSLKRKL